jgi:EpsI family protein
MIKSSSMRFAILFVAILAVGVLVNAWAYLGEAHVDRRQLKDFPEQLGAWRKGKPDQILDEPTLKVLRASDYLLRDFNRTDGEVANFYVGYYASQRDGASYHSPLNCLPGSGWTLSNPDKVTISLPDGRSFVANKYVIQNGDYKSLMIYWYQGRGRAVASEYWGKVYTVIDSVRLRRSDGAMVRVTVPLGNSETAALESAKDLSARAATALDEFVPD